MTITYKMLLAVGVIAGLALAMTIAALPVAANPLGFFRTSAVDGIATSSPTYMTPGTATTTRYYDTNQGSNAFSANYAVFALQFTGSSTASTVNVAFEYANPPASGANCTTNPTACDWYKDSTIGEFPGISTTTQAANIATPNSFTLPFASTTPGGAAGISPRTMRLITAPTYTRYMRAVVTMPTGSLNGAVWGEFVGRKESQ